MEIKYNKLMVEWECEGKKIYRADGIIGAHIVRDLIHIEMCCEGIYEHRFVSLDGNDAVQYKRTGEVTIFSDTGAVLKCLHFKEVGSALVIQNRVFILAYETENGEIYEFNRNAELLKTYTPPYKFSFYRIVDFKDGLVVICQGDADMADKFGRNDWRFVYNSETNCWEQQSLAY